MISVGGYPQLSWVTTLERGQWRRCGRHVSWPWCTRDWFLGEWSRCSITRGRACGCRHCCSRCSRCSHVFHSRHIFQRCRCTLSEVCHVPTIRWLHCFCLWALSDVILVALDNLATSLQRTLDQMIWLHNLATNAYQDRICLHTPTLYFQNQVCEHDRHVLPSGKTAGSPLWLTDWVGLGQTVIEYSDQT